MLTLLLLRADVFESVLNYSEENVHIFITVTYS